jgi:hypothetical protein
MGWVFRVREDQEKVETIGTRFRVPVVFPNVGDISLGGMMTTVGGIRVRDAPGMHWRVGIEGMMGGWLRALCAS